MFVRFWALLLTVVCAVAVAAPISAQIPGASVASTSSSTDDTALPDPLTPEAINEMVARMSDDEVRSLLLEHLDSVAIEQSGGAPSASLVERAQLLWTAFVTPTQVAIQALPILVTRQLESFSNFAAAHDGLPGVLQLFGLLALALAIAFGVEFAATRFAQRWQGEEVPADQATLASSAKYLFRRFLREILGLIVFYVVLRTVGSRILAPDQIAFAAPFVTTVIWVPRLTAAVARFVLAPKRADLRLVNVDDKWARYLHRNSVGLMLLSGFTLFIIAFNARNGVPAGETRLGFWLDSAVYVYIAIIAWTAREGLSDIVRGTDPDRTYFDEKTAEIYPFYAIGVAALMWVVVQILIGLEQFGPILNGAHYATMFWLLIAPTLDTLIRGLVRYLVPPMMGEGKIAEAAYLATKRSYIRIGRVIVVGLVALIIANLWGIDLSNARANANSIADNIIGFVLTLVVGYILYELVSLWINRRLAREFTSQEESADQVEGEGGGAGGSRLTTVLPLVRVTAQVAILVIFVLLALGSLGIDITPLLAGAGILGLAIGFGAQKLVSDIVSGIFFLVDDAFRVGEYVEIGATRGAVEKISIRSMQLRHHRGAVHTIPYGEIPQLTNYSRDWVIMKLKFTVPFDTDPNKVKKIFKKIGAEMRDDEMFKNDFIEPFKSQGVFEFDDVGIVMRGKFMARPGTQFTIRKEIYNRIKREFDEAGIDFARREVRVAIPGMEDMEDLSTNEKHAMGAAAGAAVQHSVDQQEQGKT